MSKFDYREFEQLTKSFKGLTKDYNKFLNDFIMREGNRCLANTKRLTSVDTGELRNRWKLSGPFKRGTDTKYVVIHNNLKYASWVEDGHLSYNQYGGPYGWVRGRHMGRVALVQTQNRIPDRFNVAFRNFCAGKGIG